MSQRLENTLKGLILVGLALFLTSSIINGTLLFYIHRRFAWLTWSATILLLFIASAYRRPTRAGQQRDQESGEEHQQRHPHGGNSPWIALALVALPLLLGILVPPQPLGAYAVGVPEVNTDGVGLGSDQDTPIRTTGERNILDWLRAFAAADDPAAFDGQKAIVVGFVYRDETFAADQFMVSRFIVSCCVADAIALGLVVSWPDSVALPLDTWVEVRGRFRQGRLDGTSKPILIADSVTPTTTPDQPYLYR
jgi:putative membrane protein